jgi:hypothetical protein
MITYTIDVPIALLKNDVKPKVAHAITPQAKVEIRFLLDNMIDMILDMLPINETAAIT